MSKELLIQNIERAQYEIEKNKNKVKNGKMRQRFHFMPQTGWLNDPNGLIYFKGKYHFFFQCNPYSGFWDAMHWGHAVSLDMINWKYLPIALAPSEDYDNHPKGGCFSGSAIEYDNKLFLFYTGVSNNGNGFEQTQCIAYSEDGIKFEKYEGNPVIKAPDNIPTDFFRDPKVWKFEDVYYMICGASYNNKGQALLYRSKDMFNWEFFNVLAESRGEWGYMWECPDFYKLDDRYVLTFSPMGVGDHTSVYMVGDFDYNTGKFRQYTYGEIDWGMDYYAPQSFVAPDGRRIMVGWSNGWEWMPSWKDWGPTYQEGWCGFFNIPREVKLTKNNTLKFVPIQEIKTLRNNPYFLKELLIDESVTDLVAGDGISFEIKMKVDLEKTNANKFAVLLRCGSHKHTTCLFDLEKGKLSIDRNNSDGWSSGISKSILFLKNKKELDIHIISDRDSLEIFTDNYQNNHSNNIFANDNQNKIQLLSYGGVVTIRDIETYGLSNCYN